jgi:hypothetical protein
LLAWPARTVIAPVGSLDGDGQAWCHDLVSYRRRIFASRAGQAGHGVAGQIDRRHAVGPSAQRNVAAGVDLADHSGFQAAPLERPDTSVLTSWRDAQ